MRLQTILIISIFILFLITLLIEEDGRNEFFETLIGLSFILGIGTLIVLVFISLYAESINRDYQFYKNGEISYFKIIEKMKPIYSSYGRGSVITFRYNIKLNCQEIPIIEINSSRYNKYEVGDLIPLLILKDENNIITDTLDIKTSTINIWNIIIKKGFGWIKYLILAFVFFIAAAVVINLYYDLINSKYKEIKKEIGFDKSFSNIFQYINGFGIIIIGILMTILLIKSSFGSFNYVIKSKIFTYGDYISLNIAIALLMPFIIISFNKIYKQRKFKILKNFIQFVILINVVKSIIQAIVSTKLETHSLSKFWYFFKSNLENFL